MARINSRPGGDPLQKYKPPKAKKPKTGKGRRAKAPKTKKPKTVHARHAPAHSGASDPGNPAPSGTVSAGAPGVALEVDAATLAAQADAGLLGAVWTLAGSGDLSSSALATWQREQDRLANRAWRRPGGLQRMGGL